MSISLIPPLLSSPTGSHHRLPLMTLQGDSCQANIDVVFSLMYDQLFLSHPHMIVTDSTIYLIISWLEKNLVFSAFVTCRF